jgi:hypothetical protein
MPDVVTPPPGPGPGRTYNRRGLRRLAVPVLVFALLAGTTAAFAVTEVLKLEPSPITRPQFDGIFSPTCACPQNTARLRLRLREADTVDAVMVDADGTSVRTLASGAREDSGRVVFRWDGENDAGTMVPDGRYRLRIHLDDERRTIVIPNLVRVDTEPPSAELVRFSPRSLSPDGDGRADQATIEFRLSERARPFVLVDGELAAYGEARAAGRRTLVWRGTAGGRPLPAGFYRVAIQARDRAGNVSAPTAVTAVRIRYIELARDRLSARVRGALRFQVATDAEHFRWELARRGRARPALLAGTATAGTVTVRLPRRLRAGRYVLRVTANDHGDRAGVVVRRRR